MYLQPTRSDCDRQTSFTLERTRHEFDVVCLWEQPADFSEISRTDPLCYPQSNC